MTVAEIQSVVAMYLQRSVAKFDVSGTSANLITVAMNNARKYAERRHNWSVCRKKGYLSVTTANEVAWDSPTWFGGGTEKLKEGKHWWLRGDVTDTTNKVSTTDCPIKVLGHGVKHVSELRQNYESWGEDYQEMRQLRQDSGWHPMLNQPHGVVRGKWLELYPRPTTTQLLVVDGYAWWPDWSNAESSLTKTWTFTSGTDYLIESGAVHALFLALGTSGSATHGIKVIRQAADPLNAFVVTSDCANAFINSWTLANVVAELNRFLTFGTVTIDGIEVSIELTGSSPVTELTTYDSDGFESQTGQLTLASQFNNNEVSDWWTENASEFLILRTLVECNRLGHVFTGNKEGNLPSPEKQAEQALQDLISQDNAGEMAGGQIELY